MNNQEAFTKAVTHMRTHPRAIEAGRCVYATTDGNACAVGCLLPFELAERLEAEMSELNSYNTGWGAVVRQAALTRGAAAEAVEFLGDVDQDLLRSLQDLHDDRSGDSTEDGFVRIARRFELEIPA